MDHIRDDQRLVFSHQFDLSVLPMGWSSNGEDGLTEESLKTMSRYRNFTTICCAAVFALGLAACGGGDDGISVADRDAAVAAEQAKTEALQMQIDALRAELNLGPADDLDTSIQGLQDEIARLQGEIADRDDKARMDQEEADRMAAAKTGKELFAALAGAAAETNALANIAAPALSSAGLAVDAAENAGALTSNPEPVTLKAGDSADPLGDWAGTHYANTNSGTKVMNEAVVYTNKGPGMTVSFTKRGTTVHTGATDDTDIKGYVTIDVDDSIVRGRIMAAAFTHSGKQTHSYDAVSETAFTTRGTYDGAPGEYRCTDEGGTACSSTNDGKGSPTSLAGNWHFKPDAGANAMAHQPDGDYLYYGWWVSKDNDGMPTAASAFRGMNGAITAPTGSDAPDMLAGSAMYAGHAAGKFALDYSKNKLLDGASDGGHFTANVMLSAKFGTNDAPNNGGISGTIDNFMANGEAVPWSVALHRASWGTDGAFESSPLNAGDSIAQGTTWSIDGISAPESGDWSGQVYDEMLGAPPAGDGSNVPTTVTGTFYSEFDKVGRMVGAFGANKQ